MNTLRKVPPTARWIITISLMLLATLTVSTPTSAHDGAAELADYSQIDLRTDSQAVEFATDEIDPLHRVADALGISYEEAVERIAWQNDFSLVATAIRDKFPDDFSISEISSEKPAIGTIRFKRGVPEGVKEMLVQLPAKVEVVLVGDAGVNANDVDELVIASHHAVTDTELVDEAVSSYNWGSGRVDVVASPRADRLQPGSPSDQADEVLAAVPEAARQQLTLKLDTSLKNSTESRYGGGRLERSGQSGVACTAGFNVRSGNGTTGVATAGHCANSLTHENNYPDTTEYSLTYQSGHRGSWGDFQWHTSTDSEPDNFYPAYGTSTTDVSSLANPSNNQNIYRFGHGSSWGAAYVADTSTCATLDGIQTCRLVRMNADTASGGDSGGPWYFGGTAYGFHTGQVGCGWWSTCDVWSRVTYIDNALGVSVRTY